MKKFNPLTIKFYLSIILLIAIGYSCKKDEARPDRSLPTVTTSSLTAITLTSANAGGIVTASGADTVTEKGICYDIQQNPTVLNNKIVSGMGLGSFTSTLNNLVPGTIYYVRAYATNSYGTAYGNQEILQTSSNGKLLKVVDSVDTARYTSFAYNTSGKLIYLRSSRGGGSGNNGYVDSFIYENEDLVASFYNLGAIVNPATPYARTEYTVFNNLPVTSRYYYGLSTLVTSSVYTFDASKRLVSITQTSNNSPLGGSPTFRTRFEYNATGNLSKVFYKSATSREYLHSEYLNYDSAPNPYYSLPWLFDYNVHNHSVDRLSPNNAGQVIRYLVNDNGSPNSQTTTNFFYEYNLDGRVSKQTESVSSRFYETRYFIYQY